MRSLQESIVADVRLPLLLLSGAVGLLLFIVCANVASLLLARAATRAREFAVRAALGAGRSRLLRQLLTESTLLSLLGGALGVLLAWAALRGIRTATALDLPRSSEIHLDLGVLGFALALSLLTGILFGLAPALSAFRRDLAAVLQGDLADTASGGRFRRHSPSVHWAARHAGRRAGGLSLILLVSAGLLLQSLAHLYQRRSRLPPRSRAHHVGLARAQRNTTPTQSAPASTPSLSTGSKRFPVSKTRASPSRSPPRAGPAHRSGSLDVRSCC